VPSGSRWVGRSAWIARPGCSLGDGNPPPPAGSLPAYGEWSGSPLRLRAVADRHVVAGALAGVDLARPLDLLLRVVDHLQPLRDPTAGPGDREQHREHADRHAERLVDQARVEIDVRVQLALDEVVVLERDLLQLQRDVEQRV